MLEIRPGTAIDVVQGSRPVLAARIVDRNGEPFDLTNYDTLKLMAKRFSTDPDAAALFDYTLTITAAADGEVTIPFDVAGTVNPGDFPATLRIWLTASDPATDHPDEAYALTVAIAETMVEADK